MSNGWTSLLIAALLTVPSCTRSDRVPERDAGTAPDTGIVARVLHRAGPAQRWRTVTTPSFRLHVRAGSASDRRISALGDSAEAARRTVLRRLAIADAAQSAPVDLVFADTRAEMARLVGRPTAGVVPRHSRAAFLLAGAAYRPLFRHELTHVYTLDAWGEPGPGGAWLSEGLATLVAGPCAGAGVDARTADLARRGALVPLTRLVHGFASLPEPVAYVQAASVLGFLLRTEAGLDTVRALWRGTAAGGPRAPAHPLGPDGARLERAWRAHLDRVHPVPADTLEILRSGC
ncbi:MAG TPA: hypothetical protein VF263_06490 [Longimicrobiaceae bacterium]